MPPHGAGMIGAGHSHNPEFPEDNWNLYTQLIPEETIGLNVTVPADVISIFKPHARRFAEPTIYSDADEEIMITCQFISPVHIRKLCIVGGGDNDQHPRSVRCYVNHERVDFTNVQDLRVTHQFSLPVNPEGTHELITPVHPFTNVNTLVLYFPNNYGAECTAIKYIGMQGEHTHYRRQAVNTVYEVLCNGQDIEQHASPLTGELHLH